MEALPFDLQILNTLAALLLLISFAMLSQRRIVTLVNLLAMQGALLCIATLLLAWRTEIWDGRQIVRGHYWKFVLGLWI